MGIFILVLHFLFFFVAFISFHHFRIIAFLLLNYHDERSGDESILSSSEPPAPAEQLHIAKELQNRHKWQFHNIKRDIQDMLDMKAHELLTIDINKYSRKLDKLMKDETSNSEILHELIQLLNDSCIDSVLELIDGDLRAFSKLERECKKLEEVRKICSKSIQMKASVIRLTETDVLTGPA